MTADKADKLDLTKLHKDEYATPKKPKLIQMKPARYLAIDGSGPPGESVFQAKIEALYGMAYTAKFASKQAGRDYVVGKLEALYGLGDQAGKALGSVPKKDWRWKMMMRLPDFITEKQLAEARRALRDRGKEGDFDEVQIETLEEGLCVQMLHVGPYEKEGETIEQMLAHAGEQGHEPSGAHHEIYLSDPRRVPPEKLRTILRQPLR